MDDIVFYDLQDNIHVEDEHGFLDLIRPKLNKFGLNKMFDLGLLDIHGKPLF